MTASVRSFSTIGIPGATCVWRQVPADQRAYVQEIIHRLLLCRHPDNGYARYVCPGCQFELRVPFSCKTRFCPSCGKAHVDNWVNDIARDLIEVPHLHVTLTMDDLLHLKLQQAIEQGYRDHRGFQVHTDSFYPKGLEAAQYIGRYLGHPPLATSHITSYDGQHVTYGYIDTETKQRITVTCSALDFISHLIPHLPPKGMQTVRYAGLYARNIKRKCADLARTALEAIRLQFQLHLKLYLPTLRLDYLGWPS